jgi:hypothetical protein
MTCWRSALTRTISKRHRMRRSYANHSALDKRLIIEASAFVKAAGAANSPGGLLRAPPLDDAINLLTNRALAS